MSSFMDVFNERFARGVLGHFLRQSTSIVAIELGQMYLDAEACQVLGNLERHENFICVLPGARSRAQKR
jgi:hypothetical protein